MQSGVVVSMPQQENLITAEKLSSSPVASKPLQRVVEPVTDGDRERPVNDSNLKFAATLIQSSLTASSSVLPLR